MAADNPRETSAPEPGRPEDDEAVNAEAAELEVQLRRHAGDLVLSAGTVDVLLRQGLDSADVRLVPYDESVQRVRNLLAHGRTSTVQEVAAMLRSHREEADIRTKAGAAELGIGERALQRIEDGALTMLRNVEAEKVAEYLGRIDVDPTTVLRAAFQGGARSVWGYTPGDHGETRPQATAAAQGDAIDPHDRAWIERFLRAWGGTSGGAFPI